MEFRLLCSPSKFTNEWKERQWKSMERVTKKCIYICRERVKEGGLTRHHPQTIKYQLGSCLPAKFISVRGASLLIIRWPISFRETNILRCRMQSLRESLKPLRSRFRSLEIVAPPFPFFFFSRFFVPSALYLRRQKLIARISLSFCFFSFCFEATLSMLIFFWVFKVIILIF